MRLKDFARHSRLQTRDFPFSFPGALVGLVLAIFIVTSAPVLLALSRR